MQINISYDFFFVIILVIMIIVFNTITNNHNDADNKIVNVFFDGEEYNITDYLKKHPGGKKILEKYNNCEIKNKMELIGHSPKAYRILEKYKILK